MKWSLNSFRFRSDQSVNHDGFLLEYSTQGLNEWDLAATEYLSILYLCNALIDVDNAKSCYTYIEYVKLIRKLCKDTKYIYYVCSCFLPHHHPGWMWQKIFMFSSDLKQLKNSTVVPDWNALCTMTAASNITTLVASLDTVFSAFCSLLA